MLKSYTIIAWRNIVKHKAFSLINVSGMAIGLACCLLLTMYIKSELSFDAYHLKADRIFRVGEDVTFSDFKGKQSSSNGVIAEALKKTYPEVEETVRFYPLSAIVKQGTQKFADPFYYSDASAFAIFTWPLTKGDPATALAAPYSVVLTEETAQKYFGQADPMGKTLVMNEREEYRVTGVMRNIPLHSTLHFAGLTSFSTLYQQGPSMKPLLTVWGNHNFATFVLLTPEADYRVLERKIKDIYLRYYGAELKAKGARFEVFLQPLRDIYLRPLKQAFGPLQYVYIFGAVAVFILLIACANFMNLSTARSMNRAAEVCMRKVLGSNRGRLIVQFLGEAVGQSFLAMLVAVGIASLALPLVNNFAGRDLGAGLPAMPWLIPGLLVVTVGVGLIAGIYPAFFLSRFQPVQTMVRGTLAGKQSVKFRRGLVLVQFAVSATLIIGTWLVIQQLHYMKEKDPGFDKEHVVCLPLEDPSVRQGLPTFKERVKALPGVINAGAASTLPGWGAPSIDKIPAGYTKENMQLMLETNVDEDYLSTMGIKLIAGRNFSRQYGNDPRGSVIINETAAKRFGWANPLGKTIKTANFDKPEAKAWEDRVVIGVVGDYHIDELSVEIRPAFIGNEVNHPFDFGQLKALAVRIKPGAEREVVPALAALWKEVFPHKPFTYFFMDEDFNQRFQRVERSRDIFSYFTLMATFIAVLGLFGMASYTVEKRVKEIGIRKTLGSSVTQIVKLLSKEIIVLVLAANLLAYPIAYYLISNWLADFPYRIPINPQTFLLSTLFTLLMCFLTTAGLSIKAARTNPSNQLRSE